MLDEILDTFKNKNCLITGGTGLIGRQIVDILCDAQAHIVVNSLDQINLNKNVTYKFIDLCDFNACKVLTKDIDFMFHCAGIKGSIKVTLEKPASFFVPLLQMNTNILEAARINNVQKVVYTSSIGAYNNKIDEIFIETEDSYASLPMDFYPGWAKRIAELQIKAYAIEHNLNYAIVRLANIYGPGDNFDKNNAMVIPSLIARIYAKEDPVIIWGDGSAIRDFLYSKDAAEGIIAALYYGTNDSFINLGYGQGYSIKELVEILSTIVPFKYVFDASKLSGFHKRVMNITLAKEKLNFFPKVDLLTGLKYTWEWFCKNNTEYLKRKNYFI